MTLTAGMLESAENGLSLMACANVKVDGDVTAQLLRGKLVGAVVCANVTCTEEQRTVIELVARHCTSIGPAQEQRRDENPDAVEINAAFYTL